MIDLKGGGGCQDQAKCAGRVHSDLGSSSKWAKTHQGGGVLSSNPQRNPDFAGAHRVFVPYCSSDGHRGTGNATMWGWYFQGHLNFAAIVDALGAKGLSSATQVLLSGGSAGGVGAFHNLDWLAARLGPKVVVKGAPVAGWFFPGALPADFPRNTYQPPPSYACFNAGRPAPPECDANLTNATEPFPTYKHPDCVAAQAPWDEEKCATVHVLYPFIKQPLYVIENQYDTNQIYVQKECAKGDGAEQRAYIAMYGQAMRNSTQQVLDSAKHDGIFLPSCLQHGVGEDVELHGQVWLPVLGDWFFGRNKLSQYHQLVDDCTMTAGLPCNTHKDCQLSGSGPTPPAPPPDAGACQKQLTADGCVAAGTFAKCAKCAKSHQSDLLAAGCTRPVVQHLCNSTVA